MKSYQYPDENDSITCSFIDTKSNTNYWAKSEENVLQEAIKKLQTLSPRPNLLDLGCGMGRLFSTFLPHVSSITAIEPDLDRFSQATKTAQSLGASNLQVIHGDINSVANQTFGATVCSHILQHIPFSIVEEMISKLSQIMPSGSLLLLTTTFTTKPHDIFTLEHKEGTAHVVQTVSEEDFKIHFSDEGTLPVRIFSYNTIEDLCYRHHFHIEDYKGYHFALANMPKPYSTDFDDEKNKTKDLEGAKDVIYFIRRD